ncbi:MAG: BspA family leucine-rich repeat surface protein [Lachnospiraceae bacterium]|nr:BspA family leucine-rich repeat surface protein [Lachnospiraceae bacterium]
MNIKMCSLKTMCAALACTTVFSSMMAAYTTSTVYETPMDDSAEINTIETLANDSAGTGTSGSGWTTEENSFEDIKVTYQQSSSYTVTIPKAITLGTNKQAVYSVKVAGNIDANQRVYVAPVDGIAGGENLDFYMSDLSGKKEDVVATVTQNKTYWSSENVANAYEETNNSISAPDLTAGTWEGTFQVEIRLETEKEQEHVHNYVDGKCECGAVDPNHTHNYEDGSCTICGEKDSYTTAPEKAYTNWNYTLDDTNNIITLNHYKGSETDVIVYANYVVGGKTYKTRLKSNQQGYYESRTYAYMFNADSHPNTATEDIKFTNNEKIKSIKFSKDIDTSNVTGMGAMFYNCKSLTTIEGLDSFDISNVTDMTFMFAGCESLVNLDLSGFDTSNVTNMKSMFSGCRSLTNLDISHFNTSNVTDMGYMFSSCSALSNLDVSHFDTGKVTKMSGMFNGLSALSSLDVSHFDTSNVTDMGYMFSNCSALTTLDLCSFDTQNATAMRDMFNGCSILTAIYATEGKWSTAQASTSYMFNNCGTSEVTYK